MTYWLIRLRRLRLAVRTNNVHGDGLGGAGPQQTPPAAERVGDEDKEEEAADDLDDAINASSEELDIGALHAEALEDLRGVVVLN